MTTHLRLALPIAAAVVVIGAFFFYRYECGRTRNAAASGPPIIAIQKGEHAAKVSSVTYLMAHPTALKEAEKACNEGSGPGIVSLCDTVHSAEARLMAKNYRDGADASAQRLH